MDESINTKGFPTVAAADIICILRHASRNEFALKTPEGPLVPAGRAVQLQR